MKTVPRTAATAFGVCTSKVSPGFIRCLATPTAILPDSRLTTVRPTSSVTVKTESSRTVTMARPPMSTLTMDFSPVLMRSFSKMLSRNLRGRGEVVEARATVAWPWSVVTTPTSGAACARARAGRAARVITPAISRSQVAFIPYPRRRRKILSLPRCSGPCGQLGCMSDATSLRPAKTEGFSSLRPLQRASRPRESDGSMGKLQVSAPLPLASTAPDVASAPSSPSAPAPGRPGGARHFDLERPAIHGLPVEALDRLGGILGRGHLDEAKAPRAAGVAIRHHCGGFDRADSREQFAQPVLGRREGEASDEQFVGHGHPPNRSPPGGGTPWNADNSTRVAVWLRERFRANRQPDQTVA